MNSCGQRGFVIRLRLTESLGGEFREVILWQFERLRCNCRFVGDPSGCSVSYGFTGGIGERL